MSLAYSLQQLVKTGNVPADIAVNSTLTPAAGKLFVTTMVEQSAFLKKVNTFTFKKLTGQISGLGLGSRQLVRVPQGTEPTASQKASFTNPGKTLSLQPVDLFTSIPLDTLIDNLDDPQFEQKVVSILGTSFGNDLLDLGTNGKGNDYTDEDFEKLNHGWVNLAQNDSLTGKANTNGDTSIKASLDKLLAVMPSQYRNKVKTKIIMSQTDADTYAQQIGAGDSTAVLLLNGKAVSYLGYGIEVNPFQPDGTFLMCDLKDLVFAASTQITRTRSWNANKRSLDFAYTMHCDFELARDAAVAAAWNQSV